MRFEIANRLMVFYSSGHKHLIRLAFILKLVLTKSV